MNSEAWPYAYAPGVLDDLGLIAALDWYTSDFQKRTGIDCRFRHRNVPNLDDILATAAYRITQEALTNVARHSKANYAIVALQTLDGVLILSIMDNGRGLTPKRYQTPIASELSGCASAQLWSTVPWKSAPSRKRARWSISGSRSKQVME